MHEYVGGFDDQRTIFCAYNKDAHEWDASGQGHRIVCLSQSQFLLYHEIPSTLHPRASLFDTFAVLYTYYLLISIHILPYTKG